jgi:hypothetical protein
MPQFVWIATKTSGPHESADDTDSEEDREYDSDIEVPFEDNRKTTTTLVHHHDLSEIYTDDSGDFHLPTAKAMVVGKIGSGRHLDHSIWMVQRDAFLFDRSVVNGCMR